eukprot:7379734-Prymnesium_polylepis.1
MSTSTRIPTSAGKRPPVPRSTTDLARIAAVCARIPSPLQAHISAACARIPSRCDDSHRPFARAFHWHPDRMAS